MPTRIATTVAGACMLLLGQAGCVSQDYLGDHYPATDHVDVLYNVSGVPDGYRLMGEDRAQAGSGMSSEDIVKAIVQKAQEAGADAVSIKGMEMVQTGTQTSTSGNVDANGTQSTHRSQSDSTADVDYAQNTQTTVQKDKVITALFLKRLH
jgi:hypothetical protein